jgi:glycine/serine hydroxymethyltransferase
MYATFLSNRPIQNFCCHQAENIRQEHHIRLIASRKLCCHGRADSQLTNKYAEGYRTAALLWRLRALTAEQLAIDRIKRIIAPMPPTMHAARGQ